MFKSKHKLDFAFVSMDQRGKEMLQYDDEEMSDIGGYDLVHHDDLAYVASAHQECKSTQLVIIPTFFNKFTGKIIFSRQTTRVNKKTKQSMHVDGI